MYWTLRLTYRCIKEKYKRKGGKGWGKGKGKRRRGEGRKAVKSKLTKLKLAGACTLQIDAAIQWFHAIILMWIYSTVLEKPYQDFEPDAVTELPPLPPKSISVPWQSIRKEGGGGGQPFVFPTGCSCPSCSGFVTVAFCKAALPDDARWKHYKGRM